MGRNIPRQTTNFNQFVVCPNCGTVANPEFSDAMEDTEYTCSRCQQKFYVSRKKTVYYYSTEVLRKKCVRCGFKTNDEDVENCPRCGAFLKAVEDNSEDIDEGMLQSCRGDN